MLRNHTDGELTATVALPAAGANVNTSAIDLGGPLGATAEVVELSVQFPPLPALAAGKSVTVKFQDSDDGQTFTDIPGMASRSVTGDTGGGVADSSDLRCKPMDTLHRYVRANIAVEASGGDSTAIFAAFYLLT